MCTRSESNFWVSVLSFNHVGGGDQMEIRLGSPTAPWIPFFMWVVLPFLKPAGLETLKSFWILLSHLSPISNYPLWPVTFPWKIFLMDFLFSLPYPDPRWFLCPKQPDALKSLSKPTSVSVTGWSYSETTTFKPSSCSQMSSGFSLVIISLCMITIHHVDVSSLTKLFFLFP